MAAPLRLCAFAPVREMGLLIQAAVLAKAQRRKGREGEKNVEPKLRLKKLETHSTLVSKVAGRDARLFSENGNAASHKRTHH